eukprot:474779_1
MKHLNFVSPKIVDYKQNFIKLKGLMPGFVALISCRNEQYCCIPDKSEKMRIDNAKQQWYIQKVNGDGEVTFTTPSALSGGYSKYLYYGIEADLKYIGDFTQVMSWGTQLSADGRMFATRQLK